MEKLFLSVFSDFCINMSAGWFGAAVIIPLVSSKRKFSIVPLTINILLSILSFAVAMIARSAI